MKKLIISMKSNKDIFSDFKKVAKKIKSKKSKKSGHYEISFESDKDFNHFVKNISILKTILNLKPHSVYQLAKLEKRDLSNIKKIVIFFEELGAIQIREEVVSGRKVKRPIVNYDKIEFNLKVA